MAARKKQSRKKKVQEEEIEEGGFEMNPETVRGIIVIGLFAAAALMIISFFGLTGRFGTLMESGLSLAFGFVRFLIPVVLILIGAALFYPGKTRLSPWNYIGIFFFFLSFNGLMNLLLVHTANPVFEEISKAGGYLGELFASLLPMVIGYWGSVLISIAFFFVAILLAFNTSLHQVVGAHQHVTGVFARFKRDDGEWEEDEEEEEDEEPEEEEEEEDEYIDAEEMDDAAHKKAFRASALASKADSEPEEEQVLTSRKRRKMTIPTDLLDLRSNTAKSGDIDKNKQIIEETFSQFGINVEMADTSVGPTVTQFTLRPSQGVKLSRVVGLQNDLALALAAHPLRIEAPIPGKSLVGIEIPNKSAAMVSLRELIEAKEFKKRKSNLSVPLGRDVSGKPWIVALDKMPHMLVAGATGSGKSVCLNTMIVALLYENGPDDLKLILVDPKRVEMSMYEGIPHLLIPPITKVDDTVNALKWTVREMERRLDVLSKFGARDINSYNEKAEEKMPKIVVIIDELADLMATSGREVEATISRIAQMARAVGIHLVLATQRPSVDVITGVIKANIPSRAAFAVASQTDSRTILDVSGAEKLLGRGDMLFSNAELPKPKRIQGVFVSEDEVKRVVDFLKKQGTPDYNYTVTENEKSGSVFVDQDDDPMIDQAIEVILQSQKASTSFLQRRLRIGYSRAARIIDMLEEKGIIGPGAGSKPREVLIDEWPPGGDITEGMPTDQDDYDEAAEDYDEEEEDVEDVEVSLDDEEDGDETEEWEEGEESEEDEEDDEESDEEDYEEDERE